MNFDYQRQAVREYAEAVKAAAPGISVYLAETGTHGFFTNGNRVVSFQSDIGSGIKLSGNYRPSRESGTGWGITDNAPAPTEQGIAELLNTPAPGWANRHPVYTTEKQYLATYQSSSKFSLV